MENLSGTKPRVLLYVFWLLQRSSKGESTEYVVESGLFKLCLGGVDEKEGTIEEQRSGDDCQIVTNLLVILAKQGKISDNFENSDMLISFKEKNKEAIMHRSMMSSTSSKTL